VTRQVEVVPPTAGLYQEVRWKRHGQVARMTNRDVARSWAQADRRQSHPESGPGAPVCQARLGGLPPSTISALGMDAGTSP
jgi:hypothetical protein